MQSGHLGLFHIIILPSLPLILSEIRTNIRKVWFLSIIDGPDQTACKVAFFNKDAEPQYRDGDIIKITKVYGWKKRDSESAPNSLDAKPTSEVEMSIPAYFAVSKDF